MSKCVSPAFYQQNEVYKHYLMFIPKSRIKLVAKTRFERRCYAISKLEMFVWVGVVLNRTLGGNSGYALFTSSSKSKRILSSVLKIFPRASRVEKAG